MRTIRHTCLVACLALALPSLVEAWPAAIQTGTPIRITAPTLGGDPITGSFIRHDDSTLTLKPDRSRHATRVRYAEIARLEADTNPTHVSNRSGLVLGAIGGAIGFGLGASVGSMTGNAGAAWTLGALAALPGFIIGGLVGGLLGGAASTGIPDHAWLELPRTSWAGEVGLQSSAAPDSTR